MVFYFTCIDPSYVVYMGRDKFENEDLIKYSFPEDVWFHVDGFSSAHVYLRLHTGQTINDIPKEVIEDLSQLTKYNSIQGKKEPQVKVVYTMASNLKKTGDMDTGEVGFFDRKAVRHVVIQKNKEICNRLNKTQVEKQVDFEKEKMQRDKNFREMQKRESKERAKKEKEELERRKKEAEAKSYDSLFSSNNKKKAHSNYNDDFFGDGGDEVEESKDLDDFF
ncbi:predicted protein [Naegleria gruberi]|uniref:Predicted protein n=1 Tax=Naegleria gruberi TaxID=5762 RepID=D2VGU7_NAEGR|nr:uncharacterized protein NAEGRDRAFT_33927 [Naegleria gruberi]EFC44123.1 predicted protein [Naegleria gruberi]|eukprot:XP_002676867.1 predicted protein [Naegleria gruberi strain NEG-M]